MYVHFFRRRRDGRPSIHVPTTHGDVQAFYAAPLCGHRFALSYRRVPKADAQTYSLANDFSLALNGSGGNTWSYGMDTGYSNPVAFFKLPNNTQSADALWGTSFGTKCADDVE